MGTNFEQLAAESVKSAHRVKEIQNMIKDRSFIIQFIIITIRMEEQS